MMKVIESFEVKMLFNVEVDTETGELTTKCVKKSIDKLVNLVEDKPKKRTTSKKDTNPIPTLTLEDNKYILNDAAITLMEVIAGDKLDIKYDKNGIPVIGSDNIWGTHSGNKLTKTGTVQFRGAKNEELSKRGNSFTIVAHNEKPGLFFLQNNNKLDETKEIEDISEIEEAISEDIDIDLQDLIDNKDVDIKEVPASMFQL